MSLVIVIGGTRSGKSEVAESLAAESGGAVVYVATASAEDGEMAERISRHRARRPSGWHTTETSDLGAAIASAGGATVLVDGIGPWIAQMMHEEKLFTEEDVAPLGAAGKRASWRVLDRVRAFAAAAAERSAPTIVVAEESGLGLVPTGSGTRRYLDISGEARQILAQHAARALFVVAGQPLELKGSHREEVPADLRLHGDRMVRPGSLDFAVNVAGDGPPDWLTERLRSVVDRAASYPDESKAVRAISERHGRSGEEIVPLNGSAEAFGLIACALRPRVPVVVHPGFTEPEVALRICGLEVRRIFRDPADFALDPGEIPSEAEAVFVCNPNNPTGTLESAQMLARIARKGRVLVVDEAFMDFCGDQSQSLAERSDIPGLVVLRSLTKIWSIPGIRAGYLIAPAGIAAALRAVRQPWGINALALAALEECVQDESTPRKIAEEIAAAREELIDSLRELSGVEVWPSAANFLLIRVPDGDSVAAALVARGVSVRLAGNFPGLTADHLRVAVRRQEENRILVDALREVLG